jgi:hypothetical protein
MKTAMELALARIEMLYIEKDSIHWEMFKNDCMEKEKEQIMNAYCDGAKGGANGTKGQHENGWVSIQMRNKYYNQTYNQNK